MRGSARMALLICAMSLAAAPALARGAGGHGGGHCGGAHGSGGLGGHTGSAHGHGFGFTHHGTVCGIRGGYFGPGMSNVGRMYLDRIGATPAPDNGTADDADAADGGERWPDRPSDAERAAQYRYDHRGARDAE